MSEGRGRGRPKGSKNLAKSVYEGVGLWDDLHLTAHEKAFIVEWSKPEHFFNKTQGKYDAFKAAGYKVRHVTSPKTGKQLIHPSTKAVMSEVTAKQDFKEGLKRWREHVLSEDKEIVRSEVLEILRKRATYDPAIFLKADGSLITDDLNKIPEEWRCCIVGIDTSVTRGTGKDHKISKVNLANRDKNLELLYKFMGLVKESELTVAAKISADSKKGETDSAPTVEFVFNKKY